MGCSMAISWAKASLTNPHAHILIEQHEAAIYQVERLSQRSEHCVSQLLTEELRHGGLLLLNRIPMGRQHEPACITLPTRKVRLIGYCASSRLSRYSLRQLSDYRSGRKTW
jgi:hypothetical protein